MCKDAYRRVRRLSICFVTILLVATGRLAAASTPAFIAETDRVVEGGRRVVLVVSQREIHSHYSNAMSYTPIIAQEPVTLLAAAASAMIVRHRTRLAEEAITPVRNALVDFDYDSALLGQVSGALKTLPWFEASEVSISKDDSAVAYFSLLDDSRSPQVLFIELDYGFNKKCDELQVYVRPWIARKALGEKDKPESRLKPKFQVFSSLFAVHIALPSPGTSRADNISVWVADSANRTKVGLTQAAEAVGSLLTRVLAASPEQVESRRKSSSRLKPVDGSKVRGRVIEATSDGTLYFTTFLEYRQKLK